jgi:hypothetical protein
LDLLKGLLALLEWQSGGGPGRTRTSNQAVMSRVMSQRTARHALAPLVQSLENPCDIARNA